MIFDELLSLKRSGGYLYEMPGARLFFAPDLGARVFVEVDGMLLHRLDMAAVRDPHQPFNNYGGNNFWPAPEGGKFGFNYEGDTWRVQKGINNEPFVMDGKKEKSARAQKRVVLVNRQNVKLDCLMERQVRLIDMPDWIAKLGGQSALAYAVDDRITVMNPVTIEDALVSCWTLEQFNAMAATIAFVKVAKPREAINFDFYADPSAKLSYSPQALFYQADSKQPGQIGIKCRAQAHYAGFYDLARGLLCVRQIQALEGSHYFNFADNDQPRGPYSAADNYSIFNGGEAQGFFEVETIGGAIVDKNRLLGSALTSMTCLVHFADLQRLQHFVDELHL